MGSLEPGGQAALGAVSAAFAQAGIKVTPTPDLRRARWEKLVWNIPFNGLTVVLNTTTDRLVGHPETRRLADDLMREVQAGAHACGYLVSDAHRASMMEHTDQMRPYSPSMKLDYDAGRRMELETMYARPLRRAAEHGMALRKIDALYQQLAFLDAARP
jgi:2-dehydropantoate 2-reductase